MLQLHLESALHRGDSARLVSLLRGESLSSFALTRLHQCVSKALSGSGFNKVLVVLKSLEILSENKNEVHALISHGLTAKVMLWFDAVCKLLTTGLYRSSAPLLSLTEEFYDCFLCLCHSPLPVSELSLVLVQLVNLVLDPEIPFSLRIEGIRTFNNILESVSPDQRKLIQNDQNLIQIQSHLASAIVSVGDYELQVSLSEALCRLMPRKQRQLRTNHWFSCSDISNAFCDIRDRDFEVDCRRFLNFVNECHANPRRVFTFPCVRAFLENTELIRPKDDKLDEFWIDFNMESGTVSFFVDEPQGFLWGSVHLSRDDVTHYSLQVEPDGSSGPELVLSVQLRNPITHVNATGHKVALTFSCQHQTDLQEATENVFKSGQSFTDVEETAGTSQSPPPAEDYVRTYSRKKPQKKNRLKVLPLSSPSSEEDSSVMKTPKKSQAMVLFDQIRRSTPRYDSDVPVEVEPVNPEEVGGGASPTQEEVFVSDRKRAGDSGFLSDEGGDTVVKKRRAELHGERVEPHAEEVEPHAEEVEPHTEEAGSKSGATSDPNESCNSIFESPKRAGPPSGEDGGPRGAEPESAPASGFSAAFRSFVAQLERNLTSCWKEAEQEVNLSLSRCQRQVSSLLAAVYQHRMAELQKLGNLVVDQLKQLEENLTNLNQLNEQIQSLVQAELQHLSSFCDQQLNRLQSLDSGSSVENPLAPSSKQETHQTPEDGTPAVSCDVTHDVTGDITDVCVTLLHQIKQINK